MKDLRFKIYDLRKKTKRPQGQVMLAVTIFFLAFSLALMLGFAEPVLRSTKSVGDLRFSAQSYYASESLAGDLAYRYITGKDVISGETLTLGDAAATSTVTPVLGGVELRATGTAANFWRASKISLEIGDGIAFRYASQAGPGGFDLQNTSSITGNVFSEGPVKGTGSNMIRGDVISSGPSGLVYGIHATSSAYAHSIGHSSQPTTIDKNAYYATSITNTTVTGTQYPNSNDQPIAALPISDAQIAEWEAAAEAGGTITTCDASGNYEINNTTVTLGPKKIACNLVIKGNNAVVTITGHLWVTGNITTQTGPTIKMDPALGSTNVAIVADNPSDTAGSGIIDINQNTIFQNSGTAGSFVFMISQNNSAESGGSTSALNLNQGASAMVAYAAHGIVTLAQSVSVKEVTAYKVVLQNSANVVYDTGLPSTMFDSGPSGGYSITSWVEQRP
jgi:hypothetical protein